MTAPKSSKFDAIAEDSSSSNVSTVNHHTFDLFNQDISLLSLF